MLGSDNHTCRGKYVLHMSAATIRSRMRSDRLSALQCLEPMQLLLVALLQLSLLTFHWIMYVYVVLIESIKCIVHLQMLMNVW